MLRLQGSKGEILVRCSIVRLSYAARLRFNQLEINTLSHQHITTLFFQYNPERGSFTKCGTFYEDFSFVVFGDDAF